MRRMISKMSRMITQKNQPYIKTRAIPPPARGEWVCLLFTYELNFCNFF